MSDFFTKEEKLRFASMLADLRNGLQTATEAIDGFLNFIGAVEQGAAWNPANITWTKKEGGKGPYKRAAKQDGQDYLFIVKSLKEHDGKLQSGGFFYWLFDDGETVGRKPAKGKGKQATKNKPVPSPVTQHKPVPSPVAQLTLGEAQPQPHQAQEIMQAFPEKLADKLTVQRDGEYVKIAPKQYLLGADFRKIASIVRDQLGGEYISAGKESHFRIPVEA